MILPVEIVKQIQGHKRTMIRWERLRSVGPFHVGRAYKVKPSLKAKPACEITIDSIEDAIFEDKPVWVIRFKLGNHTDEDRYPAARVGGAGGDYTSIPSRKLVGTGAEVSAHELSRFVAMRDEKEPDRLAEQKRRASLALSEIRARYTHPSPAVNRELREAQERIRTIRVPKRYDLASPRDQTDADVGSAQSGA